MVKYKTILDVIDAYIVKCDDGTDIPRVVTSRYEHFTKMYGGLDHEECSMYTMGGALIHHQVGKKDSVKVDTDVLVGLHDVNLIHNHPSGNDIIIGYQPPCFSQKDLTFFLLNTGEERGDIEYMFHSLSACSKNGYRVNIIRGNKWSIDDEKTYIKATEKYLANARAYRSTFEATLRRNARQLARQQKSDEWIKVEDFYDQAYNKTIKEIGTMTQYFKNNGVFDDFRKANCRLQIKKAK